jgi:hypothetical protein
MKSIDFFFERDGGEMWVQTRKNNEMGKNLLNVKSIFKKCWCTIGV